MQDASDYGSGSALYARTCDAFTASTANIAPVSDGKLDIWSMRHRYATNYTTRGPGLSLMMVAFVVLKFGEKLLYL